MNRLVSFPKNLKPLPTNAASAGVIGIIPKATLPLFANGGLNAKSTVKHINTAKMIV